MKGSTVKLLNIFLKVCLLNFLFIWLFLFFCNPTLIEILVYIILIFIISIVNLFYCHFLLKIKYQKGKIRKKIKRRLINFKNLECVPIYFTGNQEKYAELLKDFLLTLQEEEYSTFIEKGYIFIVGTYQDLKSFNKQKGITGLFSKYNKYILLYTDGLDKENGKFVPIPMLQFKATFYHEWGHFVDYLNSFISDTISFQYHYYKKKKEIDNSVRFMYSGNLCLYLRNNPLKNLYEFKSSSEYFAVNYSRYRMGSTTGDSYLDSIFENLRKE